MLNIYLNPNIFQKTTNDVLCRRHAVIKLRLQWSRPIKRKGILGVCFETF